MAAIKTGLRIFLMASGTILFLLEMALYQLKASMQ